MSTPDAPPETPDERTLRRWRRYLADERAEASVYRDLARRRSGEEREILSALADAESRHEQHWLDLLGDDVGKPVGVGFRSRALGWLARRLGSVFILALVQRAESRSPYADDPDATAEMAADEQIHEEVVRALAERGRNRLSGTFRAAVFGANDGLVSNLSLVLGVGASGVSTHVILLTGIAGLLAGALSMGAGEFVSVHSQRELLAASTPNPEVGEAIGRLNVNANELALVFRSRGMTEQQAQTRAARLIWGMHTETAALADGAPGRDEHEAIGTGMGAALSSFCFFASGAIVPVIPYLFGMGGLGAVALSAGLVGIALVGTGAVVGLLSGSSPWKRALRQLAIGYGAAAVTYLLGLVFGVAAG
ncbi:VIT1/CCC1 transporter family protein [Gryllotalpicola kribbensis]|jgi:VIT1/CCC1 family predicted Fe2+/Mn2+ transporter|uniref:VIT1/CCC1 transporter family protein n=1 Tax=Gryllotalpicola kribbensis TaxID=993084 RepID=A0ABP8AF74_9MICO